MAKAKDPVLKAAVELVYSGDKDQARYLMGDKFNEQQFMEAIPAGKHNDHMFNFVATFEKPDWFTFISKLKEKDALKFVENAKKMHINLFQKNEYNSILLNMMFSNYEANIKTDIIKTLDDESVRKAFLDPATNRYVVDWFIDGYPTSTGNKSSYSFDAIIKKLNHPDVLQSPYYDQLFTEDNSFTKVIKNYNIYTIENSVDKVFFEKYKNSVLSNIIVRQMLSYDSFKNFEKAKELIENNQFTPIYEALQKDDYENFVHGRFNELYIDSQKYELFKLMITHNVLDVSKLNAPPHDMFTTFERFIDHNIVSASRRDVTPEKVNKVLDEIDVLKSLGIEPTANRYSRGSLDKKVQNSFEYDKSNKMDSDVSELAYRLHLPGMLVKELVDFFDKRYNYQPQNTVDNTIQQQAEQRWKTLVENIIFIEPKNELKI